MMQGKRHRIASLFVDNWAIKVLALVLAILTFYAIHWATGYEVDYTVPVKVQVGEGIAVLDQDADAVKVRFRGTQDDLLKLDQDRLRIILRPREGEPDGLPRAVPISARNFESLPNVSVVKIEPDEVILTFDREVSAEFKVAKPGAIGSPLVGRAEIDYSPKIVMISGPKRRLEELKLRGEEELLTEPVDIDGRVESFSRLVEVLPPNDTWVSRIDPSEVTVRVRIVRELTMRTWTNVPIMAVRDPSSGDGGLTFTPAFVNVTLEGQAEIVESLATGDVRAFVDCVGLELSPDIPQEKTVQVHAPARDGVSVKVSPPTVMVSGGRAAKHKGP